MRDSGALTELLLTRLKNVESTEETSVSLRKRLMENKVKSTNCWIF